MWLPELPEVAPTASTTLIERTTVTVPPDLTWSTVWQSANGEAWAQTARDGDVFYVRITGFVDVRITAARIDVAPQVAARERTIRHLLLDQVLPLALAAEGRLVLHASAVQRADIGIIVLAGAAGTGKSTLAAAFLRAGWNVVSDDGVLVQQGAGGAIAIPAYSGLRLWPDAADATGLTDLARSEVAEYSAKVRVTARHVSSPAPLRGVYVIETGDDCRVEAFRRRDAAVALIRHAYCAAPDDPAALTAQLDACAALAMDVPVSRLAVPRDLTQLAEVVGVLSRHATFADR